MNSHQDKVSNAALIAMKSRSELEAKALKKSYSEAISLHRKAEELKIAYENACLAHNIKFEGTAIQMKYNKPTGSLEGLTATKSMIALAEQNYQPALDWIRKNQEYVEKFAAANVTNHAYLSITSKL